MEGHHYIAKALLRNFCYDKETLFYYSKERIKKGVEPRNIRTIFKKSNLNSRMLGPGKKDNSLEVFFAQEFDCYIPEFIEKLRSFHKGNYTWDNELLLRFVQFFYNHMKRTPDFHQGMIDDLLTEDAILEVIKKYEAKYGKVNENDREKMLSPEMMKDRDNMLRISSLVRQSEDILQALLGMYLITAAPVSSRKQFIIASNPVIRLYNSEERHIQKGDVELWATVSHDLAVGFLSKPPKINSSILLNDKAVEHLNTELLRQSTSVGSKNKKLLESLVSKKV